MNADQYVKKMVTPKRAEVLWQLKNHLVWVLETLTSDGTRWCFSGFNLNHDHDPVQGPRSLRDAMEFWQKARVEAKSHPLTKESVYRLRNTHTGAIVVLR